MRSLIAHARPLFMLGALLFVACSGGDSRLVDPKPADPSLQKPYTVLLSTRLDTLALGESRVYSARVTDAAGLVQMVTVDWTSTDPSVLTVNAGAAIGVGMGTAGLVARYGTAADTATVVIPDDGSSLQLSPSAVAASLGDTLEFQARLVTSSGSSTTMQSVLWTLSDSSAAQVLGDGRIVTVSDGHLDVIAAVAGRTAMASVNVARSTVASITVSPPAASINVGGSIDLNAIVLDLKGHVMRDPAVSWTVSDAAVASVDNTGKVQGVGRGGAIVSARSGLKSATATVNVAPQPAANITLALDPDTVVVGSQLQAAAVPHDANGQPVSGRPIAYQSSNPAVATITNTGLITPATAGVTNVSAICDGLVATVKLTVQNQHVVSVTIVPAAPVVMQGTTAALAISVLDQMGESVPDAVVTWSSQTPSIATVSSNGVLTGIALGSSQISATAGGVTGTAIATVNSQSVGSVLVAPSALSVQVGESATLSATALMASGQTIVGAPFAWNSSNTMIATVSALGAVFAKTAGSATITATSGGQSSSASVTVSAPPPVPVASISVTLNSPTILIGQSTQAIATLYDAHGIVLTERTVTWSSANASLATVSSSGVIAALAAGTVSISASSGGQTGLTSITLAAPAPVPVASVSVSAPTNVLQIGQSSQLTVTPRDAQGNVLSGRTILYTSSNTSIAAVSASGLVTANAGGAATITVSSEGVSGTMTYTVTSPHATLTQLSLSPAAVTLSEGGVAQFAVAGTWSDGSSAVPAVTYSATGGVITTGGSYTAGITLGTFRVIATQQGGTKADTSIVTITAPAAILLQLVLSPSSLTLAPGGMGQFTVAGTWSNGSTSAPSVTYSAAGGTITTSGLYTAGVTPGTYRVIATHQGGTKSDTSSVTVTSPPPTALALVTQPSGAFSGVPFTQQPVVELRNSQNQPVQQSGVVVTGSKASGTGTLSGPLTATTNSQGRAIFAGLLITGTGPHTIALAASGLTTVTSATFTVAAPPSAGNEITIYPGTAIQQIVNQNPAGTRFLLKAGVHARQAVTPKDRMEFRGEPGTVMDGGGVTRFAFDGNGVAVRIGSLEITKYTSDSTLGAIQGYDASDWILENLNVHHNAGYGANLRGRFTVLGGTFHHNGRLGIGVTQGTGGVIDGVDLSFNNPDTHFAPLWEAGGIKISISDSVVVRNCNVHNNVGPGIWYDGDNRASVVTNNVVTANTHVGIFYEISLSGVIRGNTISNNGTASAGPNGAGILIAASQDVEVDHNTLQNNSHGIIGLQEQRGSGRFGPHLIQNLWVHDNDVSLSIGATGLLNFMGDGTLYTRNNRFDLNTYHITGNPLPFFIDALVRVSRLTWQSRGHDQQSTFAVP